MVTKREDLVENNIVEEREIKQYIEGGQVLASGDSVLSVLVDYLTNKGYDFKDAVTQEWRPVVGFPAYEVSNLGMVRNKKTGKYRTPTLKGTYEVGNKATWRTRVIFTEKGKMTAIKTHRIVAEAFLGSIPDGYIVSHKNDIAIDNRAENLEYVPAPVNVKIRWLLNDLNALSITTANMDYVYNIALDIITENVGDNDILYDITDKDIAEIKDFVDVSTVTIREIYNFKTYGIGLFTRLAVDGLGRYYLPDITGN